MKRYIQGEERSQVTLLPECLDDYIAEDNAVRVVDVFVDEIDFVVLGFDGMTPAMTGRPSYHPSVLLKLYIYGYLNRIQSSRRLERECQRNVELMRLTGRLTPDFKTIADFRKDNGSFLAVHFTAGHEPFVTFGDAPASELRGKKLVTAMRTYGAPGSNRCIPSQL
jgi:transposase